MNTSERIEFENATLSVDPKFLPAFARTPEAREAAPYRYEVWLCEQILAEARDREIVVKARDGELEVGDDSLKEEIEAAEEAVEEAQAALEKAREDVCESIEPAIYTMRDGESGVDETIECTSDSEAREAAREWIRNGDYGEFDSTIWVDCYLTREDGWNERVTVTLNPDDPECAEGHDHDHEWEDDGAPGFGAVVTGHGGGVITREKCRHCGLIKTVDTWAQRPDTGEQGLTSVSYEIDDASEVE